LPQFRNAMTGLITRLRTARPKARIHVITPLWVADAWKPKNAKHPLESYREIIRQIVAANPDKNLRLIEGPSLIDHDEALFDRVLVHPNDEGFAQMAKRLEALIQ
jgi:ADP-heptose:LPS heptosyltransferase